MNGFTPPELPDPEEAVFTADGMLAGGFVDPSDEDLFSSPPRVWMGWEGEDSVWATKEAFGERYEGTEAAQ